MAFTPRGAFSFAEILLGRRGAPSACLEMTPAPTALPTFADLAEMPPEVSAKILKKLTPDELEALSFDWTFWARPNQLPPEGDWFVWLFMAGRGSGKTRAGAEWIIDGVRKGECKNIALVAETAADARKVLVEGPGGILQNSPPDFMPEYQWTNRQLTWPNGAIATTYSGQEPGQLRGPGHDRAWADEVAKWRYAEEAWDDGLIMGLREGDNPQVMVTTTPQNVPIMRQLVKDARSDDPNTVLTTGNTYENRAHLAPKYLAHLLNKYEGTRRGRQELHAELLEDNPNALWQRAWIDETRMGGDLGKKELDALVQRLLPGMTYAVVGVDPAVSAKETSSETGIVTAATNGHGEYYVFDDASLRGRPQEWAEASIGTFHAHRVNCMIGEVNNGGDLIEMAIHTEDPNIPFKAVHASRGKATRAEPISMLYEQRRVHHVGKFGVLEAQMCDWQPNTGMDSPDRLDALVWALTALQRPEPTTSVKVYDSLTDFDNLMAADFDL